MRFIDKFSDISGQVALTEDRVDERWVEEESRYANLGYHSHKPKGFESYMHTQQRGLCCYCMKSLPKNDNGSTIEHIIPQGGETERPQDREAFKQYKELPALALFFEKVSFKWDFNKCTRIERGVTPLPHDMHLLNMVLSCNSDTHCNHARGDQFIALAFLDKNVEADIGYNREGEVGSLKKEYCELINTVMLNDPDLKTIRSLWAHRNLRDPFHAWSHYLLEEVGNVLFARTLDAKWSRIATEEEYRELLLTRLGSYGYFETIYP